MANAIQIEAMLKTYVEEHAGCNVEQAADSTLSTFTGSYARAVVKRMIARGTLKATISETGRYQLFPAGHRELLEV